MELHPDWITGFVDGEGCFHVQIVKNKTMKTGLQVLPEFVVSQHIRSIQVLYALKAYFQTGEVRSESQREGETGRQYRVRSIKALLETIIPFFMKHPLKTAKNVEFLKFRDILLLMEKGEHLNLEGIEKIRRIQDQMNTKPKRLSKNSR